VTTSGVSYYGKYKSIVVDSENKLYTINFEDFSGTSGVGDSVNGRPFSTVDRDNDNSAYSNCARISGGGWWYDACYEVSEI